MEEQQKGKRRLSVITIALIILVVIAIIATIAIVIRVVKNKNSEDSENPFVIEGYLALVDTEGDTYTYLDGKYDVYQFIGYSSMSTFYNGVTCVSQPSKESAYINEYALIDTKSKEVVPYGKYDHITQATGGKFYKVEKDDLYGIIDYTGKEIVPVVYDNVRDVTINEETTHFFVGEKKDKGEYDYINEDGVVVAKTEKYTTINYYYTLNDSFTTVLRIDNKYYNSKTGDRMFEGLEMEGYKYNVLAMKNKYNLYDKSLVLKETVECANSRDFYIYNFNDYVLVKKSLSSSATDEEKANTYTLYDEDFNVLKTSKDDIIFNISPDEKLYYFSYDNKDAIVTNEAGEEILRAANHKIPGARNDYPFLVLQNTETKRYDIYDYTGTLVKDGANGIFPAKKGKLEKDYLAISKVDEEKNTKYYILNQNLTELPIESSTDVIEKYNGNVYTSNYSAKISRLFDKDGKQIGEDIPGKHLKTLGDHILVEGTEKYYVVDLANAEISFEFEKQRYVKTYDDIRAIELGDGIYNIDGEQILIRE